MAVTTYVLERSVQLAAGEAKGAPTVRNYDECFVKYMRFDFTQGAALGDIGSTFGLVRLPAGAKRIVGITLKNALFGASRLLDVGWDAYTDAEGTAQVADPNGILAALDVAAAGNRFLPPDISTPLDSQLPLLIYGTIAGGTIPAGTVLGGGIWYLVA